MSALDDFLTYDDSTRTRRERSAFLRFGVAIVVSTVVSWLIYVVLRAVGVGAPYVFVLATVLTLAALRAVLTALRPDDLPATLRDNPSSSVTGVEATEDGMRAAVRHWETRLDWTRRDAKRFAAIVQPAIIDIVNERLRLHHGITIASDPDRAAALIGAKLWKFLHQPMLRVVTPHEFATLLAQMEEL